MRGWREILGLGWDADERAIKRAYAARLKSVRPDVDPQGFQALHEAYQDALRWVRSRDAYAEEEDGIEEIAPPDDAWADADREHDDSEDMRSAQHASDGHAPRVDDRDADAERHLPDTTLDARLHAQLREAQAQIDSAEALIRRLEALHAGQPAADARGSADTDPARVSPPAAHQPHASESNAAAPIGDTPPTRLRFRNPGAAAGAEVVTLIRPEAEPVFDWQQFLQGCMGAAVQGGDGELEAWLNAQPALWSLQKKAQIGHALLEWLHEQRPPIRAERFDVLIAFFGFDDLQSGYDAHLLLRLRHRMQLCWELLSADTYALAARSQQNGGSLAANLRQTKRIVGLLTRPLRLPRALWEGLTPGHPTAIRRFLHQLDYGDLRHLPSIIDAGQTAFWDAAADRTRWSAPRAWIGASRCVAYAAIATVPAYAMLGLADPDFGGTRVPAFAMSLMVLFFALWLSVVGISLFAQWQTQPEDPDERLPALRKAGLPLLLGLGVGLRFFTEWLGLGLILSCVGFSIAARRYVERNGAPFAGIPLLQRLRLWHLWMFAIIAVLLFNDAIDGVKMLDVLVGGMCGLALALWGADLWRQRAAQREDR